MLVPNPSSVAKAQIGNRDFDLVSLRRQKLPSLSSFLLQVSELSERQSVGSFEISSSSEDDFEEECDDERDQEYTIYSVLPKRHQLEVVNKLDAKSQSSSSTGGLVEGLNMRPKKRGEVSEGKGGVAITSVPQSCTVHEGKILNLSCTVVGPKYTGKPAR